ncbi:MAG: exodeoxyribonuclease VII small subunit [Nanoarchaeota archaeon]
MKKEISFESALKDIQVLIEDLENGNIPLKKSIAKFKEGADLLNYCKKELKDSELSIQKILDKDGKIKFESFQ